MKIRPADKRDIDSLLEIYNYEAVNSTAAFAIRPKTIEERMEWFDEHNRDHHPLIVAERDGRAVGYASLSKYRSGDAYDRTAELSVYVDHRYRGKGIGADLMSAIISIGKKEHFIHNVISVITSENEASVRLHEKFRFRYCGTIKEAGEKFGKWLDTDYYQLLL